MQIKINTKHIESLAKDLSYSGNDDFLSSLDLDTLAIKPLYFWSNDISYFDLFKDIDRDIAILGKEV